MECIQIFSFVLLSFLNKILAETHKLTSSSIWKTCYKTKRYIYISINIYFVVVQSLSHVQLFATPRTAECQASLSLTVSWSLLRFMSIDLVMPSNYLLILPSVFPSIRAFPMSWLFVSGGQSIGVSASVSVLPMSIQHCFPLQFTGLISLQSKGRLSRVFSSTTVRKHQFFGAQTSLWSNSHICTWLMEKTQLSLDGPLFSKWRLCLLILCLGLYKKGLNDLDNHDGVVTHLEPDILECQVGLRKHY